MTRGFITVATGNEEYYRLARNLLHSYHYFCDKPLPFAVLTDQNNEWTSEFDDIILFKNGATNSYLDKLSLAEYLPYDVTIFIDSDCLAYGNLNHLFDYFENADDFSCFGRVLPLDDKTGWFEYENLGSLQKKVSYIIGLHGGIYYLRKGNKSTQVLADAKAMVPDYPKYRFKGKFSNPGDEPLVALAMATNQCKPIPFVAEAICCYWEHVETMKLDISKSICFDTKNPDVQFELMHWGTRYTRKLVYKEQIALLEAMEQKSDHLELKFFYIRLIFSIRKLFEKCSNLIRRVINKLKRMMHR